MDPRNPQSVENVVEAGLCIGCGLCEALEPQRFSMRLDQEGRLRPHQRRGGDDSAILAACPGAHVEGHAEYAPNEDMVWGKYHGMTRAWAADSDVRFRAATGGVLTAMGVWLVRSGRAAFILHCRADAAAPMQTRWTMSNTPEEVVAAAGSRYGPSDTLAGLEQALARGTPFAIIAKPCDANAVLARVKADPRIDALIVAVLVMVCGGASDLGKSRALLDEIGLEEENVRLFRYRGHGNPGPTRVESESGAAWEKSYLEMWEDEAGWRIQTRCKLCPDAIGEAADLAASDVWPGGAPSGEDAGFNGVITRTQRGEALYQAALADGALSADIGFSPRDFDEFQPHQVRKKRAIAARLRGLASVGHPVFSHAHLRISDLDASRAEDEEGAATRVRSGRFSETLSKET